MTTRPICAVTISLETCAQLIRSSCYKSQTSVCSSGSCGYSVRGLLQCISHNERPRRKTGAMPLSSGGLKWNRDRCEVRPTHAGSSRNAASATSRSASSTSTASCVASTFRGTSSSRRSTAASASATSCSAGTARTSSTTTRSTPAGTRDIPTLPFGCCRTPAARCPFEDDGLFFLGEFSPPSESVCPRGLLRRVLDARTARWVSRPTSASNTNSSYSRKRRSRCARRTTGT